MITSNLVAALGVLLFSCPALAHPTTASQMEVLVNVTAHDLQLPQHKLQKRDEYYHVKPWDPPYKGKPPPWPEDAAYPIPRYNRTCTTDARVALWKWRYLCDRANDEWLKSTNPRTRIRFCFNEPPSEALCCDEDGNAKMGQTCLTSPLWPQNDTEAAWCGNCRLWEAPCIFGNYPELNNPENICKCQFNQCYIPDDFNWERINPEADRSGYPGLQRSPYLRDVKAWYGYWRLPYDDLKGKALLEVDWL
ncbi:uncharacterized protein Z520_02844 [Fonsecaea multimorphosa CBS 102226]|uniref:Uncharacterized protein n=1 Tax=Fonsecaea multimorphosa CBS 102226 TaxID=1442371 RepID=A0A0D2IW62_9EURO|nr:uncharacterized protein Z520_02844 [Fonsecaea multimorphosa CBS 102226]KIY01292.1 hypothetical protein Z520_02844 [Fonsecaea multimorphosa CBS 102226]OAL28569.1 hypothetical protein AYO22_02763 [Fonsecaea multimorphosa]